jgi:exonuclease III
LSRLLSRIPEAAPGLHLLAGDFNSLAPSDRAHFDDAPLWVKAQTWLQAGLTLHRALGLVLDAGYVDCFRKLHPHEDGFTLPASNPSVRLDYVFASADLKNHVRACQVLTQPKVVITASDHLPLLAEFE